ncbi:MAG: MerR family transcriptional regulator [Chloroflexi bacterium]|nr:MerR family transcriptional regulator [Chloroflexota bacterium]
MYRIGDAARSAGISPATLRLWERQGLIEPRRTPGGNRWYSEDDLTLLRRIRHLHRVEHLSPRASVRLLRQEVEREGGAPSTNGHAEKESLSAPGVGDRLRARRRRAGLPLRAVAEATGMSVSFLSAVERGVTGISIAKLHALVKLYRLTVQELLADGATTGRLVRATERPRFPSSNPGLEIQQLARGPTGMEPHFYVVEPGAGSDGAYDHAGEELIFILRGCLEVWLDEREHYRMETGDCLYFPSSLPHRWTNPGPGQTELLWINTPPTF